MAANDAPKTIEEVIDQVEWLREELLTVQRVLEKMERPKTSVSGDVTLTRNVNARPTPPCLQRWTK
jgi:hypothetical protein